MKPIVLMAAAAVGVGFAYGASAADLPVSAPAYKAPVVIAPTWTGFYLGFNGGWGWPNQNNGTSAVANDGTFLGFAGVVTSTLNGKNGPVFGGQVGYNWQTGAWVLGIEGDFDGTGIIASQSDFFPNPCLSLIGVCATSVSEKTDWMASARGRIGYTWGQSMLYFTGGAAWARVQLNGSGALSRTNPGGNCNPACAGATSINTTRDGWIAGGGYEYMINPNWTVRGEYLYYGFTGALGGTTLFPSVPGVVVTQNWNKFNVSVGRVGVNYKF